MNLVRQYYFVAVILITLFVTACSTTTNVPPVEIDSTPTHDGAPKVDRDVSQIPDAIPQPVVRTRAGNKSPYTVFGKTYTLLPDSKDYQERGYASWYGTKFHGRNTANGEVYDMWAMTAAHKTLPIPSYVKVTNVHNNTSVVVKVNDRGPFHSNRIIDLSYAAAKKLGFAESGVALVEVVDVTPKSSTGQTYVESSPSRVPANVITEPSIEPVVTVANPAESENIATINTAVENPKAEITLIKSTTLQVGAFKQKASAEKLRNKLAKILPVPVNVVPGNNLWHRVHVGPIVDKQTMTATRQLLSENGIKKPYPIK